jgi:hypothetical protein
MYSYKHFTPGKNANSSRLINYNAIIDAYSKKIVCNCYQEEYKKFTSNSTVNNISNSQRVAQVINSTVGGSTQFGNYYLGEPVVFNYLGRVEGQPGGSGAPLRNRF